MTLGSLDTSHATGKLIVRVPEYQGSPRSDGTAVQNKEDDMKPSTKDQAEGKFHEVKGEIKEKAGKGTNNPNLENEGTDEKTAGKVQKKIGKVEKVLEK
jgi:uncharacterized protein YjbJ (UPF0337 family)